MRTELDLALTWCLPTAGSASLLPPWRQCFELVWYSVHGQHAACFFFMHLAPETSIPHACVDSYVFLGEAHFGWFSHLWISLTRPHMHNAHKHTHTRTLTYTLTLVHKHKHTHTLTHTNTHSRASSVWISLARTLTHTHAHTLKGFSRWCRLQLFLRQTVTFLTLTAGLFSH